MPRGRPFNHGYDSRRTKSTGRPGRLDDPEYVRLFGEAVATGMTLQELADVFEIGVSTAKEYKKDPRVIAVARKHIEDRVLEITRKVDSAIAARLQEAHKMDTDTLLKIRKEFLGGAFRAQTEGGKDDPTTVNETIAEIEKNPELLIEMLAVLNKQPQETEV